MSFRSVVNGECFEEASFNNTLSDSFQEPAVSNMSVTMVMAACLCSASHICVFHGPPSFYRWGGLKNILYWEQLQLWPSTVETAPTALHSVWPVGNRAPNGVFTHVIWKKSVKLKERWDKCPSRPGWKPTPNVKFHITESGLFTQKLEISNQWWCRNCYFLVLTSQSFGEGGYRGWEHVCDP